MEKTSYYQRQKALNEWILEAVIQGIPVSQIQRVERDFYELDEKIRRWEEEADYFLGKGEIEEQNLALDEAHEIQNELVNSLLISKFAA
ncbi:MAG: hypothetical protein DRQ88_09605 [Epsilonproteobacteria bacterium]|nr:MAG: hypothetical protein DRQ89_02785 [Campylobacterota bacterium]RLA65184.1 MAG: hypothetical protein DRQ88_09605 [Campylobacterota bacterium]